MFARESVRHVLFRQSAYGVDPGSPSGTLVPRDATSNLITDRNVIENQQIFTDGFEREFALGNFNIAYNLKAVANFAFLGWLLTCLCGGSTIVGNGVASCTVNAGGTGYGAPTLSIAAPPAGGVQATGTVTVGGGIVTAIVITNPGEGYTSAPVATVVGGGGSGATLTAVLGAPYRRKFVLSAPGATALLTELEEGIQGGALFYKYYDLVMSKAGFNFPIEGLLTADTTWAGTGNQSGAPGATSLDASAAELIDALLEYSNITTLENAADPGNIVSLSFDVTRDVNIKRPHGKGGKGSQIIYGGSKVRGKFSQYFETDAQWLKARNETLTSLQSTITGPTNYFLQALMPEVKLKPVGLGIQNADGVTQEFDFYSVRKANTTTAPIQFLLANGVVTYP
jgi:hypothetical protein